MSISFPTQGYHVVYIFPNIIFKILLLCSRHIISHYVTCHVTEMSLKEKEKEIQKKRNIKSRKIDKRKILVSKAFYNSTSFLRFCFQRNFSFVSPDPLTLLLIFLIPFQTFFQFLHIFLLPFFPIILLPIPILL